jgi:hypothetical protein
MGVSVRTGRELTLFCSNPPISKINKMAVGILIAAIIHKSPKLKWPDESLNKNTSTAVIARFIKLRGSKNFHDKAII